MGAQYMLKCLDFFRSSQQTKYAANSPTMQWPTFVLQNPESHKTVVVVEVVCTSKLQNIALTDNW